jgi:hypothetical protein
MSGDTGMAVAVWGIVAALVGLVVLASVLGEAVAYLGVGMGVLTFAAAWVIA